MDIVERLKNVSSVEWLQPTCVEAANEIEKLRKEVIKQTTKNVTWRELWHTRKFVEDHVTQRWQEKINKLENAMNDVLMYIAPIKYSQMKPETQQVINDLNEDLRAKFPQDDENAS